MNSTGSSTEHSRLRSAPLRSVVRLFPFTPWGVTLLAAASGVFVLGAARMELASLVWGSSFLLLALYTLAGSHLSRKALERHIRRNLEAVDFRLPAEGLFPGSGGAAEIASELPRAVVPGFQVWFAAAPQWPGRPALRLAAPLPPGRQRRRLVFRVAFRGLYRCEAVHLIVRDVLGFTRSQLAVPLTEQLRVFPAIHPEELKIVPGSGGEELVQRPKRRASDELLEVRKYYPGDDLRRIHWKLFAHVQELFLRTGEETPPPESHFLAILDVSPSPLLPAAEGPDMLDGMIEACASGVLALLARGMQVQLGVTDRSAVLSASLEKVEALLGVCSELRWNEGLALELPRSGQREILMYSVAGSERQQQLLRSCSSRNWNVHLFLKELPEPAVRAQFSLRRLVFRSEEAAGRQRSARARGGRVPEALAGGGPISQRERYLHALRETEARLGRTRTVHVARI